MCKKVCVTAILCLCITFMSSVCFSGDYVPAKLQVAFIIKIFNFDKGIASRAGGSVKIGILDAGGSDLKDEVKSQIKAASSKTIAGLSIEVVDISFSGKDALVGATKDVAILYVLPGNEGNVAAIKAACAENKTRSFSCVESMIEGGIGIGVVLQGGKPKILINKSAAEESGAQLSAGVLKLAKLV